MTDPATALAAAYTAALTIELAKGVGKEAAAATGKLLGWAKAKLSGRAADAVADLRAAPGDEDNQADLRKQLAKALAASPDLLADLRALLPEATAGGTTINQNLTGTGANIVGNGNSVDIG